MTLEERILSYLDFLNDAAYLSALRVEPELLGVLDRLLAAGDAEAIGLTCLCIRDLANFGPDDEREVFRRGLLPSPVVARLEAMLTCGHYGTRREVVFTLAQINSRGSLPALRRAFDLSLDRDPLLLPRLLGEIWWLEAHKSWGLIEVLAASPHFLTRWAALGQDSWIYVGNSKELRVVRSRCLRALRHDENPLVRAEAEYHARRCKFERRDARLSGDEKQQRSRALEAIRPRLGFYDLEMGFANWMHAQNKGDYSISELEGFIACEAERW